MEFILSKNNNQIKKIVKLINDKKARISSGLFVIEGIKILQEAKKNKIDILNVFMTQKFFDNNKYYLKGIVNSDITVNIITEDICNKISQNISPQSIFAICKIPKQIPLDTVLKNGKNILMLLDLQDIGNFGTIIRTANALGINYILFNKTCPDIYNHKTLRSSMGAVFNFNILEIENSIKTINQLKNHGFIIYASSVSGLYEDLNKISFSTKNVIIMGNEGNGLNKEVIDICDKIIKIPMNNEIDSLNVAVSTGIILWTLKNNCLKS